MTAPPLPGVLAPLPDHHGYLAIGGLVPLEDFGILVPGETVLTAGAVYAGAGRLNIAAAGEQRARTRTVTLSHVLACAGTGAWDLPITAKELA